MAISTLHLLPLIDSANASYSLYIKQIKLKEVLREHFARHTAGGKSTRAIVFTQFRDSVEVSAIDR